MPKSNSNAVFYLFPQTNCKGIFSRVCKEHREWKRQNTSNTIKNQTHNKQAINGKNLFPFCYGNVHLHPNIKTHLLRLTSYIIEYNNLFFLFCLCFVWFCSYSFPSSYSRIIDTHTSTDDEPELQQQKFLLEFLVRFVPCCFCCYILPYTHLSFKLRKFSLLLGSSMHSSFRMAICEFFLFVYAEERIYWTVWGDFEGPGGGKFIFGIVVFCHGWKMTINGFFGCKETLKYCRRWKVTWIELLNVLGPATLKFVSKLASVSSKRPWEAAKAPKLFSCP